MHSRESRWTAFLRVAFSCLLVLLLALPVAAAGGSSQPAPGGTPADLVAAATQALVRGDPDAAVALAQQAVNLAPADPEAHYHLGLAYQAVGRNNEAEQALGKAVQFGPSVSRYHYALGIAYRRTGKENLAFVEFLGVLRLEPTNSAAHFQAGEILADQGDQTSAVRHWEEALTAAPTFAPALKALGQSHYDAGRLDQAIDFWQRAAQSDQFDADLWFRLADALSERNQGNDLLDAVWAFRQFRNLAPPATDKARLRRADQVLAANADQAARRYVALGIEAQAEPAKAEACFRRAQDLRPDFAQAHYNLGLILQRQGRYEEAAAAYLRAANLAPDQAAVHANLGTVYLALGRPFQAEKELKRASDLAPQDRTVRLNLAVALWKQGSPGEARAALQTLAAEDASFAPAFYNLACLEAATNRRAEALTALRKAVALDGRYRDLARRDPDLAGLLAEPDFAALVESQ